MPEEVKPLADSTIEQELRGAITAAVEAALAALTEAEGEKENQRGLISSAA